MTLLDGRSRVIVLRSQRTLTGEAKYTKFGVMILLQCILSFAVFAPARLAAILPSQSRFVGSLINASTKAFCFLVVLKGKFRLQQKYLGFNPDTQEISENDIRRPFY